MIWGIKKKNHTYENMIKIDFFFFHFLKAQVNNNDIKILQDKISNYKSKVILQNGNYMSNLNKLYKIYYKNGKYEDAEIILLEILDITKKNLPERHPDFLTALNNLATLFYQNTRI